MKTKWLAGALLLAFTSALYGFTNRVHGAAHRLPLSLLDRGPLLPWTAWVYASYPLLFLAAFALEDDARRLRRYLEATLALNLASNAFFLAFPTTLDRAPAPPGALGATLLEAVRSLDAPANCLPSLHVSTSYLAAFLAARRSPGHGAAAFAWASAIAVSTVTTKQHYAADVFAGLLLAAAADRYFLAPCASPAPTRRARRSGHLGCAAASGRPYWARSVPVGRNPRASARPDPPRTACTRRRGAAPPHGRAR